MYDGSPVPNNYEVTDITLQLLVGSRIGFKIIAKDHNNAHCSKEGNHIIAQVQPSRGDVVPVELKDNKDGSYSESFVTKQVGEAKLSVTIEGEHIKGSPCNIMVCQDYKSIDKPIKIVDNCGSMGKPWAIAFGMDGVWAITDDSNHCVYIFDGQDQLVQKFGSIGNRNGQFTNPRGLAFDVNNHLYVSDQSNHRVQKFNVTGEYLVQFSYVTALNGQFSTPSGVTVHKDRLYVAEYSNNRILVFQLDGQFCCIIGSGQLRNPYDVTVSGNGHLLVTNYKSNCITCFTLDGTCVGRFDKGQLSYPIGLTTDVLGFVLVTESGTHHVTVFDQDGAYVCQFRSSGSANGQLSGARGIAVSPNGNIYVADRNNKRIQIF